jgi:hypothetical protein
MRVAALSVALCARTHSAPELLKLARRPNFIQTAITTVAGTSTIVIIGITAQECAVWCNVAILCQMKRNGTQYYAQKQITTITIAA